MVTPYPAIADHGLIGDQQTCALVATDGTIDWFCAPRFDSASVFASVLDVAKGGHFALAPDGDAVTKQLYFPDTAVLITRFMSPGGVAEIYDFMPVERPWEPTERHSIVRMVRAPRGEVTLGFEIAPRFDYGRADHTLDLTEHGAVFTSGGTMLTVGASVPMQRRGNDAAGTCTVRARDVVGFVLEWGATSAPAPVTAAYLDQCFQATVRAWRSWLSASTYEGRWEDMVHRAAITLKLLSYAPTGAPVAAATTSLPEQIGGERNWDYRYTWVRDASFSVQALDLLGFSEDAYVFIAWLRDRVEEGRGNTRGPLQIMYRVDGAAELEEFTLDHFEGYRGSAPVRVGNAASEQLQLDTYGEMLDAIWHAERSRPVIGNRGWNDLSSIVDWLCENWDQPDEGIWETRGGPQPFVYGRMLCWAALDRAIRLANVTGARPAPLERWAKVRDTINRQIIAKGWNENEQALVQHYGTDVLDASVLSALRLHYLVPSDAIWLGTLAAVERHLVSDGLVYRYNPAASPDGLRGSEGTFSMCTFWYVDALTRTGRLDDARLTFEKMLTYANHLGLYAEEIGGTGEQLGNFPQAFTHLSLINAAVDLDRELDRQAARVTGRAREETSMVATCEPGGTATALVVGAGFAGVACAKELGKHGVTVTLIDQNNYHQFQPLLYQVATGMLGTTDVARPLRGIFRGEDAVDVKQCTVAEIDPEARSVTTDEGLRFTADYLVLAIGARPNFFHTPGADKYTFPLYSVEDAKRLRTRVFEVFEDADLRPELVAQGALNFVVVGGGATGVETAGALSDLVNDIMPKRFHDLQVAAARVHLIDHGHALLAAFSDTAHEYAMKVLQRRGVQIRLGVAVNEVRDDRVVLSDGSEILTRVAIWACGLATPALSGLGRLPRGPGGRVDVGPDLSVDGFPAVYAAGDIANIPGPGGDTLPQLGSVAQQAGRAAATSILADLAGKPAPPFKYHDKGIMAMIGRHAAIAEVGPHRHELHGFVAFASWLGVHALLLSGMHQRIDAFMSWAWDNHSATRAASLISNSDAPRIDWSQDDDGDDGPTPSQS